MKQHLLKIIFLLLLFTQFGMGQENIPFQITSGFNADVIANGAGSALNSTTVGVDVVNYCFMAANFQPTSVAPPAYALPVSGLIQNASNPAVGFQLGNYTGNNSLRLVSFNNSGTFTFGNPLSASKLYVLITGGSGAPTVTASIQFSDNTTQVVTNIVTPDWFNSNALPIVISGIGRVLRTNNTIENPIGNPRMYQLTLNILPANQSKTITGIQFTKTSTAEGVFNAFAVTAETMPCQAPAAPTATSQSFCGATTLADVSVQALANATVKWYQSNTSTTVLNTSNPIASGVYYVSQTLDDCESQRTAVSITVTPIPALPNATSQQFCGNTTVSNLMASGIGNASFLWYESIDDETPLEDETQVQTGTYYVSQAVNNCESEKIAVEITVLPLPEAPNATDQTFCGTATVADLTIENETLNTIHWYENQDDTDALLPSENLVSGTYYVTQTIDDCESEKVGIEIVILEQPELPSASSQAFCGVTTVADLIIENETENNILWYENQDDTDALLPTDNLVSGTYFVAQTNNDCESDRLPVEITVNEATPAPMYEGTLIFNDDATLADIEVEFMENSLVQWYILDENNNFVVVEASTLVAATTYYVSQSLNDCESEYLAIVVESVLSADGFEDNKISVYPNPVSEILFIRGIDSIENLQVVNVLGQTILDKTHPQDGTIDVQSLENGTYLLRIIQRDASTKIIRFVKN